jgi:hypothetical protein
VLRLAAPVFADDGLRHFKLHVTRRVHAVQAKVLSWPSTRAAKGGGIEAATPWEGSPTANGRLCQQQRLKDTEPRLACKAGLQHLAAFLHFPDDGVLVLDGPCLCLVILKLALQVSSLHLRMRQRRAGFYKSEECWHRIGRLVQLLIEVEEGSLGVLGPAGGLFEGFACRLLGESCVILEA